MDMIGHYIAVNEDHLTAILEGELDLFSIEDRKINTLNVDKTWQAIQYLVCGDPFEGAPPMGYVVPILSGHAIDCEAEFGAFYIEPNEVAAASSYLNALDDAVIAGLYDFDAMVEDAVYPITAEDNPEEFYRYIYANLQGIKTFYSQAVEDGNGIVFFIL